MQQINLDVLDSALERYEARLEEIRPKEIYKWQMVGEFQKAYDPETDNVHDMLYKAFQMDKGRLGKASPKPEVFTDQALQVLQDMQGYDAEATCTQLSEACGETKEFYNATIREIGRRVEKSIVRRADKSEADRSFKSSFVQAPVVGDSRAETRLSFKSSKMGKV